MKKSVLYLFATIFAFGSCSMNNNDESFDDSEIFEEYFEEWGITIPYRDVSKSETYHLLENLIDDIQDNLFFSLPMYSSYTRIYSPTEFNDSLRSNKAAAALFEREDCVFVFISTYLTSIKANKYLTVDFPNCTGCETVGPINSLFHFRFEWVLSSEIFLSKMNKTETVQLIALVLERIKYEKRSPYPFSILISIMLLNNYTPFVEDVKPTIMELNLCRYGLKSTEGYITMPGVDDQASDLIVGYAKQFINDNK